MLTKLLLELIKLMDNHFRLERNKVLCIFISMCNEFKMLLPKHAIIIKNFKID